MKKSREFGEGPIYTITNYIMWLFAGNFYFALCNIPLIFILMVLLTSGNNITNEMIPSFVFLFMLCLIPVGPAITALLSVMGKLIREKDISITKDYFSAYKKNFKQSIVLWLIELAVITVLIFDVYFSLRQSYGVYLKYVFVIIILMVIIISLYVFPIVSRFYMKSKDIIRLSYYYSIAKFNITLINIGCIAFCFLVVFTFKNFSFLILFLVSGACYLVMLNESKILKELEEKMVKNKGEEEIIGKTEGEEEFEDDGKAKNIEETKESEEIKESKHHDIE